MPDIRVVNPVSPVAVPVTVERTSTRVLRYPIPVVVPVTAVDNLTRVLNVADVATVTVRDDVSRTRDPSRHALVPVMVVEAIRRRSMRTVAVHVAKTPIDVARRCGTRTDTAPVAAAVADDRST